jgi:hypothetical protein
MYGVPKDLDLSWCVGSHLQQVAVGKFDVQFLFGNGAKIAVQSKVEMFQRGRRLAEWSEAQGWSSAAFAGALEQIVKSGRVLNDRAFELELSDDVVLQFHDTSDQYESMQLYPQGRGSPMIVI